MSYSYKCYSDTKDIMKKYVNAVEGAAIYGLGKTRIMTLAKEAGAVYKVGNSALINTEIFESYLEKFREPSRPLSAHIWNDKNKHRISVLKNKIHQCCLSVIFKFCDSICASEGNLEKSEYGNRLSKKL